MSDKVKKISEFPEIMADNVKVLGVSQTGENVRVRLDIKQGRGNDAGALMSQAGITAELARQDAEIKRVSAKYGYYVSEESLLAVNPMGTIGDRAYVGVSAPYAIYEWNGYAWENTGMVSEDSDVNNKADKDGTYPKMSVGFAENIVGDGSATPEVFSFRPTAGENRNTLNDGAARIQTLKGSSVVWNQIVTPRSSGSLNGVTWTWDGSTVTFTGTATDNFEMSIFTAPQIDGHKYFMSSCPAGGSYTTYYMNSQHGNGTSDLGEGVIYTPIKGADKWYFVFKIAAGVTVNFTFTPILVDLTQMFGVGNEPTSVAEFYQRMPIGVDLAAYNEGEIVDGNYKAIKTTGYNQWDEQWELGQFNTSTGGADISYENIRNVNPIRVLPNTTYYEKQPNATNLLMRVLEYTQDGTYIGFQYVYNMTFTTSPNTAYVNFYMSNVYGAVYNNDICINLSWDEYASMNGTYKPYKPFVRDLSWVAKYFPNGMRSAGNVADEIRFNSTEQRWEAVQRVGVVDLGSLEWSTMSSASSSVKIMRTFFDLKALATNVVGNITSEKFTPSTADDVYLLTSDKTIAAAYHATGNYIAVYDSEYPTAADVSSFKAAMQGVLLNYELAEPIVTPIAENINFDYDVSDYGTEELISDGASAPLSANIVYEPNVLATIKNLPNLLARLAQMEAMVSAMAVSATNMNE